MNFSLEDVLSVMSSALPKWGCIYLSTPITGGPYRVEHPDDIEGAIIYNTKIANLIESSYNSGAMSYEDTNGTLYIEQHPLMINPARTRITNFSQNQYLELWKSVIQQFSYSVWLTPGFNYSEGCVVEASFAIQNNIDIGLTTSGLEYGKLTRKNLINLIHDAIPPMKASGISTESHENCLRELSLEN